MSEYIYFGHRIDRDISRNEGRERRLVYRKKKDERSEIQIYVGDGNWEDVEGLWCDYFYHYGTGQELYDIDEDEARMIMKNYDENKSDMNQSQN